MSREMKLPSLPAAVLTALKYGALLFAFGLGYQFASKQYPELTAIVGWVLGFVGGLKLRLAWANKP